MQSLASYNSHSEQIEEEFNKKIEGMDDDSIRIDDLDQIIQNMQNNQSKESSKNLSDQILEID